MNPNEEILIVSQSSREMTICQPLLSSEKEHAFLEDVPYSNTVQFIQKWVNCVKCNGL